MQDVIHSTKHSWHFLRLHTFAEIDLDGNHHRHRSLSVKHRRFEPILLNCFQNLLIQSHAQSTNYARILRIPLAAHARMSNYDQIAATPSLDTGQGSALKLLAPLVRCNVVDAS
jgi:hypothetical protein